MTEPDFLKLWGGLTISQLGAQVSGLALPPTGRIWWPGKLSTASACTCGWRGPGLISRLCIAPANVHELSAVPDLTDGTRGVLIGDRNYWSPALTDELASHGLTVLAPYRWAQRDPSPRRSFQLSRLRYRIDTVFGQLVERYGAQRIWARDFWHLASRLLRKVLSHTLAVLLTAQRGDPPLQLDRLVA
jgi:IS5 family transposase